MSTESQAPVILITGGSRGVGAATARLAAAQGYDVAISYVSNEAAAQAVAADVRAEGRRALAVCADSADPNQVVRLFAAIDGEFALMHVFFIEKSMTKEKLLAMPADDYMNAEQHAFFSDLLQAMKVETHERIEQNRIAIESLDTPADPADAASVEEERTWLVNAIDRDQRMLPQLEQALGRISDDSFGWCDDSGEPIGLKRLLISPTTKYCIEAQERHEQIDKHQRQA